MSVSDAVMDGVTMLVMARFPTIKQALKDFEHFRVVMKHRPPFTADQDAMYMLGAYHAVCMIAGSEDKIARLETLFKEVCEYHHRKERK